MIRPLRLAGWFSLAAALGCASAESEVAAAGGGAGGSGAGGASGYPFPDKPEGSRERHEAERCAGHGECEGSRYCLPVAPPTADDPGLRCVAGCDSAADCTARSCFRWYGAGDLDVPRGFCAGGASAGEACDANRLVFCSGGEEQALLCYPDTPEGGSCHERCRPSADAPCRDPEAQCADFFAEADAGLCVRPTADGSCDLLTKFCGAGETCVVSEEGELGRCFARCDPAAPACEPGRGCVPVQGGDRTLGVCVDAVPTDGPCDPTAWQLCAPDAICVDEGSEGLVCRPDCTASPQSCPDGRMCLALPDDPAGRSICAG